ncbi:hypothetical protein [Salinisphaera orenii]|uniref:hypothetical protein n=1 Tax=Salinisphaera orenii TaxID=856731 RepID=UPI0013A6112F
MTSSTHSDESTKAGASDILGDAFVAIFRFFLESDNKNKVESYDEMEDASLGHPYSASHSANIQHDFADKLGWSETHKLLAEEDD